MIGRAAAFAALLAALADDRARLRAGLAELDVLYRELLRAAAPPNRQYERERIVAQAANPRELVFLFGLLSEGENEAALVLALMHDVAAADAHAPTEHLIDEAWYYLRTSTDPDWQLDDGAPSVPAALAFLYVVLTERLDELRRAPPAPPLAERPRPDAARVLHGLRDRFNGETAERGA